MPRLSAEKKRKGTDLERDSPVKKQRVEVPADIELPEGWKILSPPAYVGNRFVRGIWQSPEGKEFRSIQDVMAHLGMEVPEGPIDKFSAEDSDLEVDKNVEEADMVDEDEEMVDAAPEKVDDGEEEQVATNEENVETEAMQTSEPDGSEINESIEIQLTDNEHAQSSNNSATVEQAPDTEAHEQAPATESHEQAQSEGTVQGGETEMDVSVQQPVEAEVHLPEKQAELPEDDAAPVEA